MPRITSPIGAEEIVESTKRLSPTGGCTSPISMLWVKMIEKCTGSTPSGFSAGARIGSTSSSVAVTSRKQPSTSSSPLMMQQELPGRETVADDEIDELVGDAGLRHPVAEGERGRHDQHDGGRRCGCRR